MYREKPALRDFARSHARRLALPPEERVVSRGLDYESDYESDDELLLGQAQY